MNKKDIQAFREAFGCEPFTADEAMYLRAMLFSMTHERDNSTAALYNKYMGAYLNYFNRWEVEQTGRDAEQDAIELLRAKGYKVER